MRDWIAWWYWVMGLVVSYAWYSLFMIITRWVLHPKFATRWYGLTLGTWGNF